MSFQNNENTGKIIEDFPLFKRDGYKFFHSELYPSNLAVIYSTLTPRRNSYFPYSDKMVCFGYQRVIRKIHEDFQKNFFDQKWEDIKYTLNSSGFFNDAYTFKPNSVVSTARYLHQYGKLPLKIKTLPEGTLVPMGVPCMTIENTHKDFAWLVGALETYILSETYPVSTAATIAYMFYKKLESYSEYLPIGDMFIDFSERGQHGNEACKLAGIGHLLLFNLTDTFQATIEMNKYYPQTNFPLPIKAAEHSVMETHGTDQNKHMKNYFLKKVIYLLFQIRMIIGKSLMMFYHR